MKKKTKRLLAMALAMTMVLQQGSTLGVLAVETEPMTEIAAMTAAETQISESETKAPEIDTGTPETKAEAKETAAETKASESETKVPETKAETKETKAETQASEGETKAPEMKSSESETKTSESGTKETEPKTQTDETTAESESNPGAAETATEKTTEGETAEQPVETESESETATEFATEELTEAETETETETEEPAVLEAVVTQEVFQKTVEGATVPMVKYTVKVANKAVKTEAEGVSLKVLLADAVSYKKEEGETLELVSFESLGKAIETAAFENEELTEADKAAYANGGVVLWKDQKIAAGEEKTFVFFAEVKDGQMDTNALRNRWIVNGKAVAEEKIQWMNTELLEVKKELPSEFICEGENGMIVTATLSDPGILPEGVQFVVKKVELTDEEIARIEAAAEGEKQLANYAAYDMHFELDGVEVEPQGGMVSVKVAYEKTNDEDFGGETLNADAAELQVIHLDEQTGAEDVTTGAEVNAKGAVDSAEFVTDSFSVFVLSQMVDVDRTFVYEDDDVKITAVVDEDEEVLNSNLAELKMEIVEDRASKEYKKLEKAVEEAENDNTKSLLGLRAYKFSFLKDGEEIEPTGKIEVTIKHKTSSIPEDIAENSVDGIEFYQITKKGKVKALEAETKTGRYNAVKKATMLIDGATLIETINEEGVTMSRDEILSSLGMPRNFAVFAIDFHNGNDMEGTIAVKNLLGSEHYLGNSKKVIVHNPATTTIAVTKYTEVNGTYHFGIFKDVEGKELATDVTNNTFDITVSDGKSGTYRVTLPNGTTNYYVYELDEKNQPIITGKGIIDGKEFEVEYTTDGIEGSTGVSGSIGAAKSYIENFKKDKYESHTGRGVLFKDNEEGVVPMVVIGKDNTIKDGENEGHEIIGNGENGGTYYAHKIVAIEQVKGSFPINFTTEMSKLNALSKKLVKAIGGNGVKVADIKTKADGTIDYTSFSIDGEKQNFDEQGNQWSGTGIQIGSDCLVINVDCTASSGNAMLPKALKINGWQSNDWDNLTDNTIPGRVIWNYYTKNGDDIQPSTGTITYSEGEAGVTLAPSASVMCKGQTNGTVIGNSVDHDGCEIHHVHMSEEKETIIRHVDCTNKTTTEKEKTGELTVEKEVTGSKAPTEKTYYKVTITAVDEKADLSGVTVSGLALGKKATIDGKTIKFEISESDSVKVSKLPLGEYTVTEEKGGYTATYTVDGKSGNTVKFTTDKVSAEAKITNAYGDKTGELTVEKEVTGSKAPAEKTYYKVTITAVDEKADLNGATVSGLASGKKATIEGRTIQFEISESDSVKVSKLPLGEYTVTEEKGDYTATYTVDGKSGNTVKFTTDKVSAEAKITNAYGEKTGELTVEKEVTGSKAPTEKTYYKVTITAADEKTDLSDVTVSGLASDKKATIQGRTIQFEISVSDSVKVSKLPLGEYTVTEEKGNYTATYTVDGKSGNTVKFTTDKVSAEAKITNAYGDKTGGLIVAKTVIGTAGDITKDFNFTVTLSDTNITGKYGEMTFTQGVATFTLKHGESKTASDLPTGITYTVTEKEANENGYITTSTGDKGTISSDEIMKVDFTNKLFGVKVSKTDVATGEELEGAHIQILDKEGNVVEEWDSTKEAHEVKGLKTGETYTLKETVAPDGYTVTAETTFTLKEDGTVDSGATTTTVKDGVLLVEDSFNKVSILKVDESGAALAGAKLVVKDKDGKAVGEPWKTDGKAHDITGLAKGSYTLSEIEAPEGYQVSADIPFEVTGKETAGQVITVEMKDAKIPKTDKRSLTVTKRLRLDGITSDVGIKDAVYYVALFSDEAKTQRVSDVKPVVFKNSTASSVTFENLAKGTYYVGETDENGTLLVSKMVNDKVIFYPEYDATAKVEFEGGRSETASAEFTNVYVELTNGLYLSGQLTVTKKVLLNGAEGTSDETYYARVFFDKAMTSPASDVLALNLAGGTSASVTVTDLYIGETIGSSATYYVAETDKDGTPLDPDAVTEFEISIDKSEIVMDANNSVQEVVITNSYTEEETETETETETEVDEKKTAPKTGDDTDFMRYLLLMALSAGTCAAAFDRKRRKARRVEK